MDALWGPPLSEAMLRAHIETLSSELRATEGALANWRTHAGKLHAQ